MIIGLHGKLRAGKDTVHQLLTEEYTHGKVIRKAFADPLKLSAYRVFKPDCTVEEAVEWANMLKRDGGRVTAIWDDGEAMPLGTLVTGRQFLQNYGTEAHREIFGKNFWVDASLPHWDGMGQTEATIFGTDPFKDLITFTDCRFPNEAERIREWGGVIWEIQRTAELRGVGEDSHASEVTLPLTLIDRTIQNNGTLEDLRRRVRIAALELMGKFNTTIEWSRG